MKRFQHFLWYHGLYSEVWEWVDLAERIGTRAVEVLGLAVSVGAFWFLFIWTGFLAEGFSTLAFALSLGAELLRSGGR